MKRYDGIVLREIIKHKKRSIFTLLAIICSISVLIFIGEVNNLSKIAKVENIKFLYEDIHGKLKNIKGEDALKLKQNSLVGNIGYSFIEENIIRTDHEDGGWSETPELIYYMDEEYIKNIIQEEFMEFQGRYPKNNKEVVIVNPSDKNIKIGDTQVLGKKERTVVGIMKTLDENPFMDHWKISGIEDVKSLDKVNANIKLKEEKNMADKLKEIAKSIGVSEIKVNGEKDEKYLFINKLLITTLGEEVRVGDSISYPNNGNKILERVVLVGLVILIYISINVGMKEKRKTYATLKCIGASNGQIRFLMLKESFLMMLFSIIPGVLLGECIFLSLKESVLRVSNEWGIDITYTVNFRNIIVVIIVAIIIVILASLIPMIWLSKVRPIEGIKTFENSKSKKIKSKFIRKVFGYECELGYKNLMKDKKGTLGIVLAISVMLITFNTFASYYKFELSKIEGKLGVMGRDLSMTSYAYEEGSDEKAKKIIEKYEDYIDYSRLTIYDYVLLRIEGLDKEIIRDSQACKYYDEEKNIITSVNAGPSIITLNDKGFNNLKPYINGKKISLEEFKRDGVIFFTNGDEGAIYPPKDRDEIKIHINQGEKIYGFKNFWEGDSEIGKFIVPKDEETITKDLNVMGTVYLETINGSYDQNMGRQNGIIISEEMAKELKIKSTFDARYSLEFKTKKLREEHIKSLEKDIEQHEEILYFNTIEMRQEQIAYLNSIAKIIFVILGILMGLMILSIVNIRDITMNDRRKEFGTLFSFGMDRKMLKKTLIYEGIIQMIFSLVIGNVASIMILKYLKESIMKFTFSYWILVIGSIGIVVICILNILNSVRKLTPKNTIDLMRKVD
ncbi:MAG: ABC transporter permease [Clostridium sp.]|uniref:ABC transporter permease n=1 Tax=Clostridium sp. TaxID=1506 RepID=UPI003EE5159C